MPAASALTSLAFLWEMAALISSTCGFWRHDGACEHSAGRKRQRSAAPVRASLPPPNTLTLSQAAAHSPAAPPSQTSSASLMALLTAALSCERQNGQSMERVRGGKGSGAPAKLGSHAVPSVSRMLGPECIKTVSSAIGSWQSRPIGQHWARSALQHQGQSLEPTALSSTFPTDRLNDSRAVHGSQGA